MSYFPKASHLQEMKFLPGCRSISCTEVDTSLTKGTMIIAGSNYGMSLGIIKQSCVENFIAQKKKANLQSRAIQLFLLHVNYLPLAFIIPWVWKDKNQVNGFSMQKKGGDSCTVIQDGHCFNVWTSLKIVMKCGLMRHSFLLKNQM